MNAIVFAAGLGTRLKPLTDNMPKALVPVAGKPMLERVIWTLKQAGFKQIVINIHHFGEQIIGFLLENKNFGLDILVSDERDLLLDTGGGIKKAAALFNDDRPFLVHNVDIVTDLDLACFYNEHCRKMPHVTLLVANRTTQRYLLFDDKNKLCGWKNECTGELKTSYSNFFADAYRKYAFGGIHLLSPQILDGMDEWPERFSIIDFYLSIAEKTRILAYPAPDKMMWFDIGKPDTLMEVERILNQNP